LPVTIVRPFNTYGPRQSARAVIPTIITQILSGGRRLHLGSLHPTRDFNYVDDTVRGFIEIASCDAAIGDTVNIGSNYEISIGATLELIQDIMDTRIEVITDDQRVRPTNSEVERLWCDNGKVHGLTGFRPRIDLREGLSRTIAWLRRPENLSRYKAEIFNV
jgi:nucleoside-diphosphate-sugar epimerase